MTLNIILIILTFLLSIRACLQLCCRMHPTTKQCANFLKSVFLACLFEAILVVNISLKIEMINYIMIPILAICLIKFIYNGNKLVEKYKYVYKYRYDDAEFTDSDKSNYFFEGFIGFYEG